MLNLALVFSTVQFDSKNKIYFQNVRGLRTKTNEFYLNILTCDYDVIVLCETWIASDILDSELFCDRYLVYRRDRESSGFHSSKTGGGVLIAVSKHLKSCRISQYESKCEDVWVCLDICVDKKVEKLFICGLYFPSPIQKHIIEEYFNNINSIPDNSHKMLILGDFNMGSIQWNGSPGLPLVASINQGSTHENMLSDFIAYHNLNQYNWVKNNKDGIERLNQV